MSKNYAGVEDLLCDESLLSWYFKTDLRAIRQWDQWVAANPGHLTRIEQAVEFLQSVRLEEISFSPGQITHTESLLLEKIRLAESQSKITRMPQRRWWAAAACVLLLAGLGIGYLRLSHPSELRPAHRELRTNHLPHGPAVICD